MKRNPKIVEILIECGRRTARKHGFSRLHENGKINEKVETMEFVNDLGKEVGRRLIKTPFDPIETEIMEHMIASLEEMSYDNRSEKEFMEKCIEKYKKNLDEKDPLVTYNGGKTRYSKLDLQKCFVQQKPSGEYVATDLDPKEIEKAEKKKEKNRKARENKNMKKKMAGKEEGFQVETVDEE
uniref:Protein MNN4-like n=1 Tax=Caenorhabditis tropicalis TaxID=1561998 RepID=A0A1I7TUD2_9PELO